MSTSSILKFSSEYVTFHHSEISKSQFNHYIRGVKDEEMDSFYQLLDDGFLYGGCSYDSPNGDVELKVNNRKVRNFSDRFSSIYDEVLKNYQDNSSDINIFGKNEYSFFGIESYSTGTYQLNINGKFDISKFSILFQEASFGKKENTYQTFIPTYDGTPFAYEDRGDYDSDYMVLDKTGEISWVNFGD